MTDKPDGLHGKMLALEHFSDLATGRTRAPVDPNPPPSAEADLFFGERAHRIGMVAAAWRWIDEGEIGR